MKLRTIIQWLETLSPLQYAEDWDNVGLLLGDEEQEIHRIMIALDASDYVIEQALDQQIDLLITHHPMIFRALKQVNTKSMVGRRIWKLATHRIAYYAMHTNFDIKGGMAELAGQKLGLLNPKPLEVTTGEMEPSEGIGRVGDLEQPSTVKELAEVVKTQFEIENVMVYGDIHRIITTVAISPGSGKSEIDYALQAGAELLITGDIGHHEGMDAVDMGLIVMDATHYGLEHIFIPFMADYIQKCSEKEALSIICMDTGSPVTIL